MKRLGLALALALWAGPALAQNVTCSTRPAGDSSNACASTAFVTTALSGGGGGGVTSIQGMTGALTCGANMVCSGGVINSGASGSAPALGPAHIFVGNGSAVAADYGAAATFQTTGDVNFSKTLTVGQDAWGGIPNAALTVTRSGSAFPISPQVDTYIQISGVFGAIPKFIIDAASGSSPFGGVVQGRLGRGTVTTPTPVQAGDQLLSILGSGFQGFAAYGNAASITLTAAETFDTSHHGGYISMFTVPLGTAGAVFEMARFQPSGGLSVGGTNVTTDPGSGIIRSTGLTLTGVTGASQCLQVDASGVVSGSGNSCTSPTNALTHSHIYVGNAANVATDFGTLATFNDLGLMTFAINTGGVGSFYNVMSSTVPLNTAVIAWRLTDNVNNTVDFGLTGNGAPAPFTGTSFIRSSGNFIIDANTPSAIIFGIGLVEAGRWDQNGHLQLTYLQGGGNQCLIVNGAGVVSGTGSTCGIGGGGGVSLSVPNTWTALQTFSAGISTSALTLSGVTGLVQCLHVNTAGVVSGTGTDCGSGGGGGTPGGSNTQVQYNSSGVFAGAAGVTTNGTALAIGAALTPDAPLTINVNTTALPAGLGIGGMALHIGGADGANTNVILDTFSNAGMLVFREAAGSLAARTPTVSTTLMAIISAAGYAGAGQYAQGVPQIQFWSAENYTLGTQGNYIQFNTVAVGTTTNKESARVQPSGGFSVGASNALPDPGVGIIRATGLILSGITGSIQCLHVSSAGVVSGTGSDCGSGGGGAVSSVSNADGSLTIAPTTGAVVASLNLAHANIWTGTTQFSNTVNPTLALDNPSGRFTVLGFTNAGAAKSSIYHDNLSPSLVIFTTGGSIDVNLSGTIAGRFFASGGLSVGNSTSVTDPGSGNIISIGARFAGITGATRCLHVDTNGNVSGTASDCGATAVGGGVTGVSSPGGTLTVGGTTGITVDINLAHTNTWTAQQTFALDQNGATNWVASNPNTGTSALAAFVANGSAGGSSSFGRTSSGYTALAILGPNRTFVFSDSAPIVMDTGAAQPIIFGINNAEVARFNGTGLSIQPGGQGVVPDAPFTINMNTVQSLTGPPAGTALHIIGANDTITYLTMDTIGTNAVPLILGRNAIGTRAAPLPLIAGSQGLNLSGYGWNGIAYTPLSSIVFAAGETLSASNNGSNISFYTNTLGVPNFNVVMRIQPSGGLSVGTANISTDGGNGVIVATKAALGAPLVPDTLLTVNANTTSSPTALTPGTVFHLMGANAGHARIAVSASTGAAALDLISSRGTLASPAPSSNGDFLGYIGIQGRGVTTFQERASTAFRAAETWTDSAQGTYIAFSTTAAGTTATNLVLQIQPSGGLSVGSANVATDGGNGTLVASQVVMNGTSDFLLSLNKTTVAVSTFNYISFKEVGINYTSLGVNSGSTAANPVFFIGRYPGGTFTQAFSLDNNGLTATLLNAASANTVCYNSTSQIFTYTSGTCTVSALSAKNLIAPLSPREGYDIVMAEEPWRYTLKPNLPTYSPGEQIGLVADYADKIDPRLVTHNADGSISGFRYEQYTAALTAAFKYLKADNDNLRSELDELKRKNR